MTEMSWKPPVGQDGQLADADAPRKDARLGLAIAGFFFIGLLGWAALTPLDAGAFAEGVVAVSGNRQAVQHRDGGVVTEILVSDGATVEKGQVLLKISASDLVATERALTAEVYSLLAQRARLMAERDGMAAMPATPDFTNLPPADQQFATDAWAAQRLVFETRRQSIGTERSVLNQRVLQIKEQISGYDHQMTANREQQRLIQEELTGLRTLVSKGFVSLNRIRAIERDSAALSGAAGAYRADIARSREAVGETRLQAVSLERTMMEEVAGQLRDVQVRLDELQPRLSAAREQLARAVVRAPASGRVVGLKVFTVSGVVAPGETLMEIVPQDRELVIQAKVSPGNADDVKVGMDTQVRFPSFQERNLPILHGRVSRTSADSFEDERTGMRFFRAEIKVTPEELAKIEQVRGSNGLQAGLPAEVLIPLRKRTALDYLIEPLTQTLWRAGREH